MRFAERLNTKVTTLLGLQPTSMDSFYEAFRFNIFIFLLCILQKHIYLLISQNGASSGDLSQKLHPLTRQIVVAACRHFALLTLLLSSLIGNNVTLFKLGYLFSFCINVIAATSTKVRKSEWYFTVIFAALVLITKYLYQFDDIRSAVERNMPSEWVNDIGLRTATSLRNRFQYLVVHQYDVIL